MAARRKKSLVEEHYSIDKLSFALLGPLAHDANRSRDYHDYFNIIALPCICAMNYMCWDFRGAMLSSFTSVAGIESMWRGNIGDSTADARPRDPSAYYAFTAASVLYIVIDLGFVVLLPKCVRSPRTIIIHHVATLIYMAAAASPCIQWGMGACMSVELNTFFLILRRVINKDGVDVWRRVGSYVNVNVELPANPCELSSQRKKAQAKAARGRRPVRKRFTIKLVSICFYFTWFLIRLVIYPLLIPVFYQMWRREAAKPGGHWLSPLLLAPIFQTFLTYLNIKWSVDLVRSKCRGRGPASGL